jgi:hypothetical protein
MIAVNELFNSAADEQHPDKIEAEFHKPDDGGEIFNLFDPRHHLRDPEKNADAHDHQQGTPNRVIQDFFFCHGVMPQIPAEVSRTCTNAGDRLINK